MSQAADNLARTDVSLVWRQLSEQIDALVAAWQGPDGPPRLADFLPEGPAVLRRLTLVEAVKVDMEYRWQQGRDLKRVEDYVAEFPELEAEGGVPCDIIYEEYHIRRQRGDATSIREYCERFPTRVDELKRLFELECPEQTSSLVPAEPMPVFEVGQQIDDFDLLSSLGKGAFATVFLARQRSMQRMVALKISRDRGFEPQTLAQLDHPHIVRVFDQRQVASLKLRLLYMQYVSGGTLRDVVEHARTVPAGARNGTTFLEGLDAALARQGEQPPADSMTRYRLRRASWTQVVTWLGARLAGALAYAHQHGVLHRDVKPANVLVGADGQPKLADFNISFSKLDGATPAAYFGGSLAYMSPEQLEACDPAHARSPEDLDGRSDVYSLGVLLWELLTGRRPFVDDGLPETWSQMLPRMTATRRAGLTPEALALAPRDASAGLIDVLRKCLAPDLDERYGSAAELAHELELCLQPRARSLMHGRSRMRSLVHRHPVTTTVLVGLLPNIVMSVLNIVYNWQQIVNRLSSDEQRVFLQFQLLGVNGFVYTIGLGYVVYTSGSMLWMLVRLARGEKVEPPPTADTMRRCLMLGSVVAMLTAVLWAVSGFIFPAWMNYAMGSSGRLSPEHFAHFVASNLLCGMIAATQSYYVVTFLCVRYCYPWLMQARTTATSDVADLADLMRRGRIFLGLTLSVPFIALTGVVLINFDRTVIGALGGIGLAGCGLAYLLDLAIRADAAALAAAINPTGDPLGSGDSVDSFLSGSR